MAASEASQQTASINRLLLRCGAVAGVANFLMASTLYLAFAAGLWRTPRTAVGTRVGVILIAAAAVGLLGSGVFISGPVSGYPPGTPSAPGDYTTTGALHDLFAVPTFLGIPGAQIVCGYRFFRRRNCRRTVDRFPDTALPQLAQLRQ